MSSNYDSTVGFFSDPVNQIPIGAGIGFIDLGTGRLRKVFYCKPVLCFMSPYNENTAHIRRKYSAVNDPYYGDQD
jgi:hypothetical protein